MRIPKHEWQCPVSLRIIVYYEVYQPKLGRGLFDTFTRAYAAKCADGSEFSFSRAVARFKAKWMERFSCVVQSGYLSIFSSFVFLAQGTKSASLGSVAWSDSLVAPLIKTPYYI